jgi:hypothetical protein
MMQKRRKTTSGTVCVVVSGCVRVRVGYHDGRLLNVDSRRSDRGHLRFGHGFDESV